MQPPEAQTYVKYSQSEAGRLANPPAGRLANPPVGRLANQPAGRLANPPAHNAESNVKIPQSDAEGLANPPPGFSVDNELINPRSSARSHSTRRPDETPIREILVKHANS